MRRLILVRHGEIHSRWRGCCYGSSDIGLSSRGQAQSRQVASQLAADAVREPIETIYSSDLRRAAYLAERLARRISQPVVSSPALREVDFGDWEKLSWDEIHATTGQAMNGMISAPEVWKPPGGETTFEMRDRVLAWYRELPTEGTLVAISHGGPIAALLGTLRNLPVPEWLALVPPWGSIVEVPQGDLTC